MNDIQESESVRAVRFGPFEADLEAGELRKRGLKLKLEGKPFQILSLLLQKAGEVVTRRELREKLWSPDTYVVFDRNVNTAVNKLRQALGDSAESPRFVETLARRGYRFIAPVEVPSAARSRLLQHAESLHSIAALPFQNIGGDPSMEYLSDGITERLISTLSQFPDVRVMARSTVFRYKGREVDAQTAGRELGIHAVLTGRVVQQGDTLLVAAELVDVATGWQLWGEQYLRKSSAIFAVEEEIARDIATKLKPRLTREEEKRLAKRCTESAEAYRAYLKGRYHWNKLTPGALNKGIAHFEQAIGYDPSYALAYAGLADCYSLFAFFSPPREVMPKAKEAALKALDLDETLAEAHASLAGVLKAYDWNWPAAEKEYRRALELNPNYETAHRMYAAFLSAMGRQEEAIQEIERAQEIDPLSLAISNEVAWDCYMAGEYDRTIEQSLKTLEMEPAFPAAYQTLGLAYEQTHQYDKAIAAFEKARDGSGGNPVSVSSLAHALALGGRKSEAKKILSGLQGLAKRAYVAPYSMAVVYAGLSEKGPALEWLEKAVEERDVWLVWVKRDPRFDRLRSSPRFEDLLRRLRLPP